MNPLRHPPAADRILLVRLGAIGDVVRTLPAASALRAAYPGAHVAWLVEPASRSAVEGQPWVDEVLVFPRAELAGALRRLRPGRFAAALLGCVRALRRRRFDLVVDFHSIGKSALLARASGAPVRVGYAAPFAREGAWWLATARAKLPARRLSRFARNLALVEFLGVPVAPDAAPLRAGATPAGGSATRSARALRRSCCTRAPAPIRRTSAGAPAPGPPSRGAWPRRASACW